MTLNGGHPQGATPLNPDELSGLKFAHAPSKIPATSRHTNLFAPRSLISTQLKKIFEKYFRLGGEQVYTGHRVGLACF